MPTVKYTDLDISKLTFSTPEENKTNPGMTKNQLLSIPQLEVNGKNEMPIIQGPWMTLDNYGITSKNDKSGQPRKNQAGLPLTDSERGKLKIPFNLDDPSSKALYDLLCSIDDKCEAERDTIFGSKKKGDLHKYQPIVRQSQRGPDVPDDEPDRPDYFVVKLDFDWKTKALKSDLWINDAGERTEVAPPTGLTLDEFQKHVRYMCEFRPIFTICKLFASKSATGMGKESFRSYGLGLKLRMIEVKPIKSSSEGTETFFIDTDNEDEERKDLLTQTTKTETVVKSKAKVAKNVI